jgi:hypothetical protein
MREDNGFRVIRVSVAELFPCVHIGMIRKIEFYERRRLMPELKYRKYFLNELSAEQRFKGFGKMPAMVAFTDADIIEGSQYFSVMVMGPEAVKHPGHGPHIHQDPELLVALGTDMSNPRDLGAKIEMCMGPEMESHIMTESTMIWIPAKFIHAPFRVLEVTRPFLFIQCQYAPKLTETGLKKLVKEEERDKMLFLDVDGQQKDS